MAIEEPKFTLVDKDGSFELRVYADVVVAEVIVAGDQQEAGRKGFGLLAGYIFGDNSKAQKIEMTTPVTKIAQSQKIAMTAPVTQIFNKGQWLVRFTMPAKFALEDLPVPNNKAVVIKPVVGGRFAVLRFSGLAGETHVAEQTAALLAKVQARGLVSAGPVSIARYNPPWTPWFLRRNEVMLAVAKG